MPEIRALDLFCGAGGSSWGAKCAGATPVAGVDLWARATETYSLNFPNATIFTRDLANLRPQHVLDQVGPIDLLLASPECTNHSVAKGAAPRDEESKRLAFQVIRFAKVLKPRWIVVENVIQMRTWDHFQDWLSKLQNSTKEQYKTWYQTLDASHFGVPQRRRRLFIVASRDEAPFIVQGGKSKIRNAARILTESAENGLAWKFTPLENGRRAPATLSRAKRAIAENGEGNSFIMVYYGSDGAGGWQSLDRPLRTVTTLDRFALVRKNCHGYEMRMLQPPELAAAMGFPKQYKWPEITRREHIKLLGNAVCPPVMRALVKSLLNCSA
jgi:DNA (cytosine-5)-methyltransferase 1